MNIDELEARTLDIRNLFLDVNNPRFWTEKVTRDLPDRRIPNEDVQARTQAQIEKHGLQELRYSILRNGFLPLDRIVVREIEGHEGQYVVVEGNRRLAALKSLRQRIDDEVIDEEHISEDTLQKIKDDTNQLSVLVYTGSAPHDIAWLLQGIRHVSGIRDWAPAQRGRLVADQIDREGLGFGEAGQRFGLTAQAVGRYYRSYKALEQMRRDDEFQSLARNDYFTLFEEAIRNREVRRWLAWSDEEYEFTDSDSLRQFYSWIVPDSEHPDGLRRIHDPRQVKKLAYIIAGGYGNLVAQIDTHEITIDGAHDHASQVGQRGNWELAFERAGALIADIPQAAVAENAEAIIGRLEELTLKIDRLRQMAEAVRSTGD